MKLGFIGLGQMGRPMALNLLKSGLPLAVHSSSSRSFDELERAGAITARHARDVASADVIFLCLPDARAVEEVLFGEPGIADAISSGKTVIDTSTSDYLATKEISGRLAAKGVRFLDAPVSGMASRAAQGTLTIMCGGMRTVFDAVEPLLRFMGSNVLYVGGPGSGQLAKLVNQLLFDVNCAALGEILAMAAKMGLDPDQVGTIVNSGTGRSYASEFFVPRILKGSFSDGYPMSAAYKDLVSAAVFGARNCIPMPVLAAATATYQATLLRGHGSKDKGAMVLAFEELLGVGFRSGNAGASGR